jgi:mRNA-degrading endonuclease toxin of MazEF toxin-antitoxin module
VAIFQLSCSAATAAKERTAVILHRPALTNKKERTTVILHRHALTNKKERTAVILHRPALTNKFSYVHFPAALPVLSLIDVIYKLMGSKVPFDFNQ